MKQETITWFSVRECLPPVGMNVLVRKGLDIGIAHISCYIKGHNHDKEAKHPSWKTNSGIYDPEEWANVIISK